MADGYVIKETPEDFVVREDLALDLHETGAYGIFLLQKRGVSTPQAVAHLAKVNSLQQRAIGYAGNKDARAVTEQHISVKGRAKLRCEDERITVSHLGFADEPITLGSNKGNRFTITVRNVAAAVHVADEFMFPNYFGEQRFVGNNREIGLAILQRRFGDAAVLAGATRGRDERAGQETRDEEAGLAAGADGREGAAGSASSAVTNGDGLRYLQSLPKRRLRMYVHAYQSGIFNALLAEKVRRIASDAVVAADGLAYPSGGVQFDDVEQTLPLPGFGLVYGPVIQALAADGLDERSFVIRQMLGISEEGVERRAFCLAKDVSVIAAVDETDPGTWVLRMEFWLPKGSYATVAIAAMMAIGEKSA